MASLHILVVSPDPSRRDHLLRALEQSATRAVAVPDSGAAVEHIDRGVDALVLDLTLPDLDMAMLRRALKPADDSPPDSLDAAERRHLSLVLRHTAGNKRKAAHILGISRSTLLNKVRKYGLETP